MSVNRIYTIGLIARKSRNKVHWEISTHKTKHDATIKTEINHQTNHTKYNRRLR